MHGAWLREETARWFETRQHQATRVMHQAILDVELDRVEDSTQLWMEVLMRYFVGGPITNAS